MELPYEAETYRVIGACFEVYNEQGCGFLEPVYQECLERELVMQKIPFTAQSEVSLHYKGEVLTQRYRPDFLCFNEVIVEIKAVTCITDSHRAQTLNYLHACEIEVGLLVNFGHSTRLEFERFANLPSEAERGRRVVREAPLDYVATSTSNSCA